MITNFKVDSERIENMYESILYSADGGDLDPVYILRQIQEKLLEEQNENGKAPTSQMPG